MKGRNFIIKVILIILQNRKEKLPEPGTMQKFLGRLENKIQQLSNEQTLQKEN